MRTANRRWHHEDRRICRLRLGLIRRGGESFARRRSPASRLPEPQISAWSHVSEVFDGWRQLKFLFGQMVLWYRLGATLRPAGASSASRRKRCQVGRDVDTDRWVTYHQISHGTSFLVALCLFTPADTRLGQCEKCVTSSFCPHLSPTRRPWAWATAWPLPFLPWSKRDASIFVTRRCCRLFLNNRRLGSVFPTWASPSGKSRFFTCILSAEPRIGKRRFFLAVTKQSIGGGLRDQSLAEGTRWPALGIGSNQVVFQ